MGVRRDSSKQSMDQVCYTVDSLLTLMTILVYTNPLNVSVQKSLTISTSEGLRARVGREYPIDQTVTQELKVTEKVCIGREELKKLRRYNIGKETPLYLIILCVALNVTLICLTCAVISYNEEQEEFVGQEFMVNDEIGVFVNSFEDNEKGVVADSARTEIEKGEEGLIKGIVLIKEISFEEKRALLSGLDSQQSEC
uniref:Transmembrane protein n=1 Tax=Heterorhabditis bacteriophora TaxID=37862 RepID=A0A1I7X683_HETBA